MEEIQVLLIEDDKDWMDGLTKRLNEENDIHVVGQACSREEAVRLANKLGVDVVLMDTYLGDDPEGIQATKKVHQICDAKVVMFSGFEDKEIVLEAFQAGADGYVLKERWKYVPDAVRMAYHDESPINPKVAVTLREAYLRLSEWEKRFELEQIKSRLTRTEIEIIRLIAEGYKRKTVAENLFVSELTVKNHINRILKKMGEKRIKTFAEKAKEAGII